MSLNDIWVVIPIGTREKYLPNVISKLHKYQRKKSRQKATQYEATEVGRQPVKLPQVTGNRTKRRNHKVVGF